MYFCKKFMLMSAREIRRELHEIIDLADEKMVAAVYVMLQILLEGDQSVVGLSAAGEPLTRAALIDKVRAAYAAGKGGNVKSAQEVLAEVETW
jgi:hypothetical protein